MADFGQKKCNSSISSRKSTQSRNANTDNQSQTKDEVDLIFSATYGHFETLLKVLVKGISPYSKGSKGRLPLHNACVGGHDECVKILLDHMTDIEGTDCDGMTATHLAGLHGEMKCLKLLVAKGANLVARDNKGRQAAHLAAMRNHSKVLRFLLDKSVDLDSQCNSGKTPLHYAAQYGSFEALVSMVERDCDMTIGDNGGYLPAHYAAHYNKLDCLRFLIKQGTSLEATSTEGKTPAHTAALYGSVDILHWLLEKGSDPNTQDNLGNTAGHYATEGGKADCFNCYLQHGGVVDIQNLKGDTTLDNARRFGHPLLMEKALKNEITCPECFHHYQKIEWDKTNQPTIVQKNITNNKRTAYVSPLPPKQKPSTQLQQNMLIRETKHQQQQANLPTRDLAAQFFGQHLDPNDVFKLNI
ncbi:ankyrin-3 [Patella vulgata]|uniref:ankyrin-3 n=1 Tax=Patella vulgata TaxID=6465 RepID=UPI0021806519|nr:ankyrin-3 [Patella vulgata]